VSLDLDRAAQVAAGLAVNLTLLVTPGPDAAQFGRVLSFAHALAEAAPSRLCSAVAEAADPDGASLGLVREGLAEGLAERLADGRVNIRFRALPEGLEFGVFLAALECLGQAAPAEPLELAAAVSVECMTLPACTHCAPVAEALCRLAARCPQLSVAVVDLQQAPQYVQRYALTNTPTLVANGRTNLHGRREADLAAEIAALASGEHERAALALRLEAGEAAAVAEACLKEGRLPEGLCRLVLAEGFATRLGVMVALQQVAAASPTLAAQAVSQLAPLLRDPDPRNRGDAAYLLGELGCPEALPHLQPLLSDHHAEVVSATQDAIATLMARLQTGR